jgi:hypothetical protein
MATVQYTRTAYNVDTVTYDGTNEAEITAFAGIGNVRRRQAESPGVLRLYVYGEAIDVGDLVAKDATSGTMLPKITPHKRDTEYTEV